MGMILGIIGSVLVGGAVATATIVGVVQSQTAAPDKAPNSVSSPAVDYGSN
jgi:L-lactate permease